jgi:hypothetical protein
MCIQCVYKESTYYFQWVYNGYTMAAENYESASAPAMQYNRTRTRTHTEEGNEPQHKSSRQHASRATRRGSAGRPAKRQAMTVTSRSRVRMFCASGATTFGALLLSPSKSCYCTVANSAICQCVIITLFCDRPMCNNDMQDLGNGISCSVGPSRRGQ